MKPAATLSLDVRSLASLLDDGSSPLLRPRIHPDAGDALIGQALEHPAKAGYVVRITAPSADAPADSVAAAVRGHFAEEARQAGRTLGEHLRQGYKALVISLLVVAALFAAAESLHALGERRIYRLLSESLIIIAWVTMWIPVESLIFENLSQRRRRNILRALSEARVEVGTGGRDEPRG